VASPPVLLRPTSELVITSWLGTAAGLSPAMVATTLPADVGPDNSPAAWVRTGFITVAVVGGSPDYQLPVKKPVMQIDTWATRPGSNKPPWFMANALAETIRYATVDRRNISRVLTINANGVTYPPAVVQSCYVLTEPRRMYDDAADYARFSFDVAFTWLTVNDRID
jgi:hypothetical protein